MLREIVLDTETTGLDPHKGDRLIEIGCVELINRIPSGVTFHRFLNPERDVPKEAEAVHGIATDFLLDKPLFKAEVDAFLAFIADSPLIIHNANFDMGFINAELVRAGKVRLGMDRVVDTLQLARRKHPAGPNSLDALCKRYGIDNSHRTTHGAIVDSLLLAGVYIELLGERQASLGLASAAATAGRKSGAARTVRTRPRPLPPRIGPAEREAHRTFVKTLGADPVWKRYLGDAEEKKS